VIDPFPADTGCEESPSCLSCPLPACVLDDDPEAKQNARQQSQREEIEALMDAGMTAPEVAAQLGIARRTVYHRLKRGHAAPVGAGRVNQ